MGNAFPVPIIDILLRPLQEKYAHKEYENYAY
jgi:hypothetical protein